MNNQVRERFERAIIQENNKVNINLLYGYINEVSEEKAKDWLDTLDREELVDQLYKFMLRCDQFEGGYKKNSRTIFDSSTEQLSLFEGDDEQFLFEYQNKDVIDPNEVINVKSFKRKRPHSKTIEEIKESLEDVVDIDIYPEDIDYNSDEYVEIGVDIKTQLELIPAHLQKQIIHIHKFAKKNESDPDKSPIHSGSYAKLIEGSVLTPSLAANLLFTRYALSLPMPRVSKIYQEMGATFSDQTLRNWCSLVIRNYFALMHNQILEDAKALRIAHMDEIHLPCMESQNLGLGKNTNIFSMMSGKYEEKQLVYFTHTVHKKIGFLVPILGDRFFGHMMSDDLRAYEEYLAKSKGRCLLHSRRRFVDLYKLKEKKIQEYFELKTEQERREWSENPLNRSAFLVLRVIYSFQMIYVREVGVEDLEELKQIRLGSCVYAYQIELDCQEILRSAKKGTKLFNAASYFIKNEMELCYFLFDPELPKDNNRLEGVNRYISKYRNTSFKINSFKGAEELAIIESIVATAEINGLYVQAYMNYFLEKVQGKAITDELLEELAPYSRSLPKELFNPASVYYDPSRFEEEE